MASMGLSQRVIKPKLTEVDWKGIIYNNEWSVDLRLHENGASVAYNKGKIKTYYKTDYYHLELGYTKDQREKTITRITAGSGIGRSATYAFGKVNSVINLRAGIGRKRYLSEKEKRKGLAVGYTYQVGPTIALLKPYYLDLFYIENISGNQIVNIRSEKYSEDNAELFLDPNTIYGKSSFFKGFNEIRPRAGVQGKFGLHLDMGAYDKYVKAFETGIMFDIFASTIPILLETETDRNQRLFFRFYLNLQFGRRNNK